MKSRWRSPVTISLNARPSWPTSSRERTGTVCERSPAATRPTAPVSALMGRVRRWANSKPRISAATASLSALRRADGAGQAWGEQQAQDQRGDARDQRAAPDRHVQLVEPIEIDVDG